MPIILIIDDDKEMTALLNEFLTNHKYQVQINHNPLKALEYLQNNSVDLVLLDIMMPEMDGLNVLRKIREHSEVPVMMLTAKGDVADKVVGLELGADDYLPKPFEPQELIARVQSILRRVKFSNSMVDIIEFDNLVIDKIKEEVILDGEVVHLSTSEFEALTLFIDNNANYP